MSTNISNDYSLSSYSTNKKEKFKTTYVGGVTGSVVLVASTMMVSNYDGKDFTLTDVHGTPKTYIFDDDNADGATGALSTGQVVSQINGLGSVTAIATQIRAAIISSNGHNGTIAVTDEGGGSGRVICMQTAVGTAGNTSISEHSGLDGYLEFITTGSSATTSFTGGVNGNPAKGTIDIAPFRSSVNGAPNLRLQSTTNHYQTFIGEEKL